VKIGNANTEESDESLALFSGYRKIDLTLYIKIALHQCWWSAGHFKRIP